MACRVASRHRWASSARSSTAASRWRSRSSSGTRSTTRSLRSSGHGNALWPYLVVVIGARRDPLRDQLHAPLRDGAHRHPRRGAHARAPLPGVPALPARVLRPARDRPGRLARDERPLPDPLLHRLGPHPGRAVADDDRRDQRRPVPGEREAGRDRDLHDAARRHPHVQLRAQGDADLAPGAAAPGRRHGGGGRGGRRDRDGAGVRPRGRRPGPLRREGGRGARRRAAPGARRGRVPARPALPADALDRRRRPLRRPRRDRRRADLRRVLPLLPTAPADGVAARGARLDPVARPARDRLGVAQLRVAAGDRDDPRGRRAAIRCRRARSTSRSRASTSRTARAARCSRASTCG